MAECKVYSVKVEPVLNEYLESGELSLLQKIVRESDNFYYVGKALDKFKNAYELSECLDGVNAWEVASLMRNRMNTSAFDYMVKHRLVGKYLPRMQQTDAGDFSKEKRWTLEDFYNRKFGRPFNYGPQLSLYDLENQVNERDLEIAYKNVTLDDMDRLERYLCRIDGSDEFSYRSSQDGADEFKYIFREYVAWSNGKLSELDLLTDEDKALL